MGKNYKEIAEQYVRSKRGHLMELSFGCLIKNERNLPVKYIGYNNNQHALMVIKENDETPLLIVNKVKTKEIIGHRPNLQDWLAVLGEKNIVLIDIVTGGDIAKASVGETYITFYLTTGQPANELDYKLFNDITRA